MGMNGIPRAFSPSQFRQEFLDFKRKVEQQLSGRTYVDLANITVSEGGTIDSGVGDKLTETVKDKIVIDGGNLGEGALDGQRMVGAIIETNDAANRGVKIDDAGLRGYDADGNRYMKAAETGLEMTGSISTKGKTAEAVPRDITVQLTTVTRFAGSTTAPNPGLVFDDGTAVLFNAPGVHCPDGETLVMNSRRALVNGEYVGVLTEGTLTLQADLSTLRAKTVQVGMPWPASGVVDVIGKTVNVGEAETMLSAATTVNLRGNVKVNGGQVMKTVTPNIPAGAQPVELIASGSATTSAYGEFTITFPAGTFPTACIAIFIVPNSGGGTIPVVNGTSALTKNACNAVQPGNANKAITYSYRAIGY